MEKCLVTRWDWSLKMVYNFTSPEIYLRFKDLLTNPIFYQLFWTLKTGDQSVFHGDVRLRGSGFCRPSKHAMYKLLCSFSFSFLSNIKYFDQFQFLTWLHFSNSIADFQHFWPRWQWQHRFQRVYDGNRDIREGLDRG